jgi:predicted AlkP superfamily pyrophosphatase or phosphodiesterase
VIGHLQGVDHISHAINKLDLKEMADMLDFHNKFVSEVISSIDENTLFVAFSDHGMWENGLHGTTGFFNETDTFMFAYTKKGFFLKN